MTDRVIEKLRRAKPVAPSTPDFGPDQRRVSSALGLAQSLPVVRRKRPIDSTEIAAANGALDSVLRLSDAAIARTNAKSPEGLRLAQAAMINAVDIDGKRNQSLARRDDATATRHWRWQGAEVTASTLPRPDRLSAPCASVEGSPHPFIRHAVASDGTYYDEREIARKHAHEIAEWASAASASAAGDRDERRAALLDGIAAAAAALTGRQIVEFAQAIAANRATLGSALDTAVNMAMRAAAHAYRKRLRAALVACGVDVDAARSLNYAGTRR